VQRRRDAINLAHRVVVVVVVVNGDGDGVAAFSVAVSATLRLDVAAERAGEPRDVVKTRTNRRELSWGITA
jgi:hypothetical protein